MNKNIVNKDIIIQRSKKYGNNFEDLAKLWNNYLTILYPQLEFKFTPNDTAIMMQLHKISRLMKNPNDKDTMQDMFNYSWLGLNYEEYAESLNDKEEQFLQQDQLEYYIQCSLDENQGYLEYMTHSMKYDENSKNNRWYVLDNSSIENLDKKIKNISLQDY